MHVYVIKENNFTNVLDMCTGSGCIACMIAKLTSATVLGTDISIEAIETAFKNMEKRNYLTKLYLENRTYFQIYEMMKNLI